MKAVSPAQPGTTSNAHNIRVTQWSGGAGVPAAATPSPGSAAHHQKSKETNPGNAKAVMKSPTTSASSDRDRGVCMAVMQASLQT
jgi:hypothetical protein